MRNYDACKACCGIRGRGEAEPLLRAADTRARAVAPGAYVSEAAASVAKHEPKLWAVPRGLGNLVAQAFEHFRARGLGRGACR